MNEKPPAGLTSMIIYGLTRRRGDLAEMAKKHPTDDEAAGRVVAGLLTHLHRCGFDVVAVRPPVAAHSTPVSEGKGGK